MFDLGCARKTVLPAVLGKSDRKGDAVFLDHLTREASNLSAPLSGKNEKLHNDAKNAIAGIPHCLQLIIG